MSGGSGSGSGGSRRRRMRGVDGKEIVVLRSYRAKRSFFGRRSNAKEKITTSAFFFDGLAGKRVNGIQSLLLGTIFTRD